MNMSVMLILVICRNVIHSGIYSFEFETMGEAQKCQS